MPGTRRSALPYYFHTPQADPAPEVDMAACSSGSLDFDHSLFAPIHYASGYAYPLIVWLHGPASDEGQLRRIMPLVSMRNYVAVAPRGVAVANADQPDAQCWGWSQADDDIQCAETRVFECIELAASRFHIEPRRVFLGGFLSGGTMALRLAMLHPERFAGVMSLCGSFPVGGTPFGNLIAARRLGIFLATSRGSQHYPATQVCDDLRLLHAAGLSLTLRQYPCGQELLPPMLADMNRWIMEQISAPAAGKNVVREDV